jgi:tRNA A-37 threonylcarbamoyl transferase component Bud32
MFKKHIVYSEKRNRAAVNLEIELQQVASKHGFTPKIHNTIFTETQCIVTMDKIDNMCLADSYGDKPDDLPQHLWEEIRNIVNKLYVEEGIEYVDITPYNFIEVDGKIYIIDFGDAYYKGASPRNWFHKDFLEGTNAWNPDFA